MTLNEYRLRVEHALGRTLDTRADNNVMQTGYVDGTNPQMIALAISIMTPAKKAS